MDVIKFENILKILEKETEKFKIPLAEKMKINPSPFKILVAVLLSSRTKDEITAQAVDRLFKRIKTPEDLLKLKKEEIAKLIYPVGFYNIKAEKLKKLAKVLVEKYKGRVPDNMEELLKLPGVGRKTANLVLIRAFKKDGICVDTHVHRIVNRIGFLNTKRPEETERELRKLLPRRWWKKINFILVKYGQNICKPINPLCIECKIKTYCKFYIEKILGEIQ